MDNSILKNATATVTDAIKADNDGDYEKAYGLYQRSLEQFMVALRYEKNKTSKEIILQRVDGYMARAEQLKDVIKEGANKPKKKAAAASGSGGGGGEDDEEKTKLRGALAGAIITEKPNVAWDDVAGLEVAKDTLKEAVILPVKFPQLFKGRRVPWKGILLYGPPGTGKSYLAKAVATEADSMFYSVSSSDLVSKWQGESERLVRSLFEMARENSPSIIFIDEIDSLCGSRGGGNESANRIKTEFLVQMQGVGKSQSGVLVLGATNVPWSLDPAMRRRFEKRIYISLPNTGAREYMFRLHIGDTPHTLDDDNFKLLGEKSEGMSGSDISVAVREALMNPVRMLRNAKFFTTDEEGFYNPCREYPPCPHCPIKTSKSKSDKKVIQCKKCGAYRMSLFDVPPEKLKEPPVSWHDFEEALKHTTSSVAPSELKQFEDWTAEFGEAA